MTGVTIETPRHAIVVRAMLEASQYVDAGQRRAQNRTAARGRTQGARRIAGRVTLAAVYIRERTQVVAATPSRPVATIRTRARETRLDRFKHREFQLPDRKGTKRTFIAVQVKRGRPAAVLPGAFKVPLKRGRELAAGGLAIAMRPKGSRRAYEVLYSSSVRDLFRDEIEQHGLGAGLQAYYVEQVDAEARRAIARATR